MVENIIPGPMTMIKIDGQKIKQLREQQGLTQLYLATAVDVTTDTISRWENKRYPSIKSENGVKLAEALGVELDVILDNEKNEDEKEEKSEITDKIVEPPVQNPPIAKRKAWPFVLLSSTLLVTIFAFIYFYINLGADPVYNATRISPLHFTSGHPFPVVIEVTSNSDKESAFILKEQLFDGAAITSETPTPSGKDKEKGKITWLAKMKTPSTFSYIVQADIASGEKRDFSGTIATSGGNPVPLDGATEIVSSRFHWADANKDNVIDDKEILTVYDNYSVVEGLESEIDLIEEIWLGDGYTWNSDKAIYEIIN